jgi:hypothetical protein
MPKYNQHIAIISDPINGLSLFPSGSNYIVTSSAPAVAAEVQIKFPPTLNGNLISNTELNPFIRIPIISSSFTGTGNDEELVIRFFTSSHFQSKHLNNFNVGGGGNNVFSISSSIYYTASSAVGINFRDILVNPGTSGSVLSTALRNTVFNAITGSAPYRSGLISASKQGNFTSSIHYVGARGVVNPPIAYTGSLEADKSFFVSQSITGTGLLNFQEAPNVLHPASSSFNINFDNTDKESISFNIGTASLGYAASGRTNDTLLYFSGSGNIGLNTNDPQSGFDAIVDEVQFQKPGSRKGLKINNEGNIESFNKDANSSATGSEFVLKYSRGANITQNSLTSVGISSEDDSNAVTVFNALSAKDKNAVLEKIEKVGGFILPVQTGDTLGAIRWVAESGSATALDPRSTGETAVLKAVVSDVDATGVQADLIFSVAGKTGAAEQKFLIDAGGNHEITGSLDINGNLNASNVSLSGDITLADNKKIANSGGTYIQVVNDDYWRINANNANVAYFTSTSTTINPDSVANVDFKVNSNNNVAINMDASTDSLTFGVPITSSGDISSSGAITANSITGKLNGGSF